MAFTWRRAVSQFHKNILKGHFSKAKNTTSKSPYLIRLSNNYLQWFSMSSVIELQQQQNLKLTTKIRYAVKRTPSQRKLESKLATFVASSSEDEEEYPKKKKTATEVAKEAQEAHPTMCNKKQWKHYIK